VRRFGYARGAQTGPSPLAARTPGRPSRPESGASRSTA
jgi:hypothetical protein